MIIFWPKSRKVEWAVIELWFTCVYCFLSGASSRLAEDKTTKPNSWTKQLRLNVIVCFGGLWLWVIACWFVCVNRCAVVLLLLLFLFIIEPHYAQIHSEIEKESFSSPIHTDQIETSKWQYLILRPFGFWKIHLVC